MPSKKETLTPILHQKATWYVEWYTENNGKRHRIRKSTTYHGIELNAISDIQEREKVALDFLSEVIKKITPIQQLQPHQTLFATAIMDAVLLKSSTKESTMNTYRSNARWLVAFFQEKGWGNITCEAVAMEHIQAYFDYQILIKKVSNRTHNVRKNNLRALFTELVERKYITTNFLSKIRYRKETDTIRRPLSESEEEAVVAAIMKDRAMFFAFIVQRYLGVRPDEIRHLRCGYFRLSDGLLVFPGKDSKNNRNSPVTIPDEIMPFLAEMKLHTYPQQYFVLGKGNKSSNQGFMPRAEMIGKNTLSEKFRLLFRSLHKSGKIRDITGLQFYSLKDTLAIGMLNVGIDVESAMRHLRQRDLTTFQRYVKRLGIVNEKIRAMPVRIKIPGQ